jgi:hypothetical protein
MYQFFWDLYQQRQISELQRQGAGGAAAGEIAARQTLQREAHKLDDRIDRLVLTVNAMWTLLCEKTDLTEADLLKRITELDGADGVVDGRIRRAPVRCSKCDAMVSLKFNRCLFCGEAYTGGNAFHTM